ncbi:MAG: preprotein translocase subunit [Gallionellaceae bacterium]|nr:MAG: preprotein translocase subunit [Gallionellaceae bacterium]
MISISNLFISNAYAEGAAPATGGGLLDFLPLIALLAVFYFLVLRPQQKRAKEVKVMLEAMQKGDEVVTTGGVLGRVAKVGETYVAVEVAEGITVNVQKIAIQTMLPKGTIKAI